MIRTIPGLTPIGSQAIARQTVDMTEASVTVGNQVWCNNRTAYARQDWKITEIIQVPYLSGIVGS